ncbi:hypothetical protein LEP1GSC021_2271 [Leptospira noguchii str. 1993005606]|uniref:Uncharacterized protein n=2 Tax=Leptospira noguchii TaxID=28182 RepID=M6YH02_9LEPT|nr:hypothetical protein LEP1GSC041_1428 [Leptospira noguchii str. 2006001870]EMO39900.1 hypothetical protein LEP1GSC186_1682 [Leptospira noguchii serovar Autumnalis str. ZUN142]EMO91121.1 hypothetical protein LEP1GSC024_4515 [Leptospira noguchii str. 2001034031]EMS85421.1 hypothetical protein LEP1GSC074_1761 [Leptospira noguchii str. Hook]EPE84197.1 hypothetical protein LEP1GSC021_2271 [Leptospira noguchii str. 1993005606]
MKFLKGKTGRTSGFLVLFPFKKISDSNPDFRKISSDYNHTQAAQSPFCNQNIFCKTS